MSGFNNSQAKILERNLFDIQKKIAQAAESVGRSDSDVTLVAVSKTVSVENIRFLYDLGVRDFGESKLQEAIPKIQTLPEDIIWHFIGHLQSNKARKVAELFSVIHTIASESQLRELEKSSLVRDVFIEINIAQESNKSGISVNLLDVFKEKLLQCKGTRFRGLMTIGPALPDAEAMRSYFKEMNRLNQLAGGTWLSMGMSGDFDVAIQEGATHVRVGSALFGARS